MGKLSMPDITAARRTSPILWLPGLSTDYLQRDFTLCERSDDPGYAEVTRVGKVWAPVWSFYRYFPASWSSYDTSLFAGIALRIDFTVESYCDWAGPVWGSIRMKIIGGIGGSHVTVDTSSYDWFTASVEHATLPSGLVEYELQFQSISVSDTMYFRRGGTDGVPSGRCDVNSYFVDGT